MNGYRVDVDLADFNTNSQIRRFNLREYAVPFCNLFIEANNPDEAASGVLHKLLELLLDQDHGVDTRVLCRKIRKRIRITKIKPVQ